MIVEATAASSVAGIVNAIAGLITALVGVPAAVLVLISIRRKATVAAAVATSAKVVVDDLAVKTDGLSTIVNGNHEKLLNRLAQLEKVITGAGMPVPDDPATTPRPDARQVG